MTGRFTTVLPSAALCILTLFWAWGIQAQENQSAGAGSGGIAAQSASQVAGQAGDPAVVPARDPAAGEAADPMPGGVTPMGSGLSLSVDEYDLLTRQAFPNLPDLGAWVEVRDGDGNAITGLTPESFEARVGAQPLEIRGVTSLTEVEGETAFILLLDRSGSMKRGQAFDAALTAGNSLIDGLTASDVLAIVPFGDDFQPDVDFSGDKTELKATLSNVVPDHTETHLYDALAELLGILEVKAKDPSFPRRKVILILSDGEDEGSESGTLEQVTQQLRDAPIPLFAVGFESAGQSEFEQLRQLVETSRGRFISESDPAEITRAFEEFKTRVDEGYLLEMTCEPCVADGSKANLVISLSLPGAFEGNEPPVEMYRTPEKQKELEAAAAAEEAAAAAAQQKRLLLIGGGVAGALLLAIVAVLLLRRKPEEPEAWSPDPGPIEPIGAPDQPRPIEPVQDGALPPYELLQLIKVDGAGVLDPEGPYGITSAGLSLGREAEIRLLGDDAASNRHCRFRLEGDVVSVEDLGSTNSTIRNGTPVQGRERLVAGDELKIGSTRFRVEFGE